MACPAPTSRSSAGRSAVSTSSGTPASSASTTAGRKLPAAVPDVEVITAGSPVALAMPSAKNAAQRSSTCECTVRRPSRTSASTSGGEREPGDVHAWRTPLRTSSSTSARRRMWVSRSAALIGDAVGVPETVVLLHGFAGTGRLWDPVAARLDGERYRPLAPDLRGHGAAAARRPVSFDGCVEDVLGLVAHPVTLCGYSMGGRIALMVALATPERIERLILVATTAGIEDAAEREQRRIADEALASEIEQGSIEEFHDRWTGQPLFAGTPPEAAATWHADILDNEPGPLAAALRGLGTGVMEPLWDRLGELTMPATVLAGERDPKFRALGERLAEALPRGELVIVDGAGHGIPREQPAAVAAAVRRRR